MTEGKKKTNEVIPFQGKQTVTTPIGFGVQKGENATQVNFLIGAETADEIVAVESWTFLLSRENTRELIKLLSSGIEIAGPGTLTKLRPVS